MDPLSIAASITAILTAAVQVSSLLRRIHDAPASVAAILVEVEHIRIVFQVLQTFVDRAAAMTRHRAALIGIEDLTVMLTQTVLVFSELQTLIAPLSARSRRSGIKWRFDWSRQEPGVNRLVTQLQRHKSSLSLLLQVIQCNSDLRAREIADTLQHHIEHEVDADGDLAARLERVQLPPGAVELATLETSLDERQEMAIEEAGDVSASRFTTPQPQELPASDVPEPDAGTLATYDAILAKSRIYDRVKDREMDAMSTATTSRSHAWSVLSGVSMAQISVVAIISLPLHEVELQRFRQLLLPASEREPATFDDLIHPLVPGSRTRSTQVPDEPLDADSLIEEEFKRHYGLYWNSGGAPPASATSCLEKQLSRLERNPSPWYSAGPAGDNMYRWQGTIMGLPDSPYMHGLFFVDIRFPGNYPWRPPQVRFITRIYHPNINVSGVISLDILGANWVPHMSIDKVLLSIVSFLDDPNVDEPLVPEIAQVYKTDRDLYNATAKAWTMKWAR